MKIKEKQKAIELRSKGFSLNEIKDRIAASKSTISLWVRDIELSKIAQARIEGRMTKGQIASRISKRKQTLLREEYSTEVAQKLIKNIRIDKNHQKAYCAMIYYCEGVKDVRSGVRFTNSDSGLIRLFMTFLRKSFFVDEKKFRACIHLHSYHDENEQLKFWSKTSNIPVRQFVKSYHKKHSGQYKKEGYQGCVSIRYGDVNVARELKAIAIEFMKMGL